MIVSELIILITSITASITASILAIIKMIHKSRTSFCRSNCCGMSIEQERDVDDSPQTDNIEVNNISTI